MILSIRGWGREEFRSATPAFVSAARWALFAERLAPEIEHMTSTRDKLAAVLDEPISRGLSPDQRLDLAKRKVAAEKAIPQVDESIATFRETLYPEDDPLG